MTEEFTHFDGGGAARMVEVGHKPETERSAIASARIRMDPATRARIQSGTASQKGDVLGVARIAGIQAAKKTSDLIPLCHPLALTSVVIDFAWSEDPSVLEVVATARIFGRTGVEMEALTAVTVSVLTVYDMCKAVDRGMTIERVRLEAKSGGQSGDFRRGAE